MKSQLRKTPVGFGNLLTRIVVNGLVCTFPTCILAQVEVQVEPTTGTEILESGTTAAIAQPVTAPSRSNTVTPLREDTAAVEAAEKIAPSPGEVLQSTEERSLESNTAVAPAPPVRFVEGGDKVLLADGETTEAVAVRSAAELMKMLGVRPRPKPVLGYESEETTAIQLFDEDAVRKLIASEPTVVYRVVVDDTPIPDPMIVPWIRNARLLQEMFDKALEKLEKGEVDAGRQDLLNIISEFPNTEYAQQASEILKKLAELTPQETPSAVVATKTPTPVEININPNVKIGSVLADPQNPADNRVMIGGRGYAAGDKVRGFPDHTIIGITEDVVTVEVQKSGQKKTFDIPVRPNGSQ